MKTKVSSEYISQIEASIERNVFVMMRYRDIDHFKSIENVIRATLDLFGLETRLAKDRSLSDDLWENIEIYMKNSKYGIAVFEEIDTRDFNPNISLELGYMYALERRCLLLKDMRMSSLPTDTCGKIYKNFDTYNIEDSITKRITEWCSNDLGLKKVTERIIEKAALAKLIYTSDQDPELKGWTSYNTSGSWQNRGIQILPADEPQKSIFQLQAKENEKVGINKSVRNIWGKVSFEYKADSENTKNQNFIFYMIPMEENGPGRSGLIEVGANFQGDPRNEYSQYRNRYILPIDCINDGKWHNAELHYDFRNNPTAFYSIFGPRINEGVRNASQGVLSIRNINIYSFE